ncbi:MAG: Na/Pi cotransporter family protein [Clostridiales bacterium]|nr:Na/Pi cotransporter family protein [Clostridiales bacterium]
MDIFNVLSLLGGLAMFLYGMNVMGDGLAKTAGSKLEQILEKLTSTPIRGVILGACVTAVIQSSSATTVMVVGFVNSGIMKLSQAVGIIMGANVGTTITSWILSLSGIEGESVWIQLLKPSSFSPVLAVLGIAFLMFAKSDRKKDIGTILLGFTVLMFGMDMMSDSVSGLRDVPQFTNILTMFSNPLLGMVAGAVLTAVIQSSSASVGILQALCITGAVPYSAVIPIIMGQNIGTCITALLSAVGAKKNAKRAAVVHLYFNLLGTVIFMTGFYLLNAFLHFSFMNGAADAAGIAVVHSCFNVIATLCLLPLSGLLEKLAIITVREDKVTEQPVGSLRLLDVRFLEKPAFAVAQCVEVGRQMAELSKKALFIALDLYENYDEEMAAKVIEIEEEVDCYDDELGNYLVRLSSMPLSYEDNQKVTNLLHCIGDFERISDHAINIMEIAQHMNNGQLNFSEHAKQELKNYSNALREIMNLALQAFIENDIEAAIRVEPLEEVIDYLHAKVKRHHIKRLQSGKCTIELGLDLEDLITNYERTADHCSNIAVGMLQTRVEGLEAHEYVIELKNEVGGTFQKFFEEYRIKYVDNL